MHHRPAGPPLSARLSGSLTRWWLLLRAVFRHAVPARPGRLLLGAAMTTTVVGIVLAVPVISGIGGVTPSIALDSSESPSPTSGAADSPVVMGLDGRPQKSAAFAGVQTSAAVSSAPAAQEAPAREDDVPSSDSPAAAAPGTDGAAPAGAPSTGSTTAPGTSTRGGSPSSSPRSPTAGTSSPTTGTSSPTTGTTSPGPGTTSTRTAQTEHPESEPGPTTEAPPASTATGSDPAAEVVALVTAERAAAGCGALATDGGLAAAAAAHSAAMSASGVLGLDGLAPGAAATLARGSTAASVVAGWLADPADRAVVLDCSRTAIGVGTVDGWWTQILA